MKCNLCSKKISDKDSKKRADVCVSCLSYMKKASKEIQILKF